MMYVKCPECGEQAEYSEKMSLDLFAHVAVNF